MKTDPSPNRGGRAWSGTSARDDSTNMEGQYPPGDWGTAIFGGPQPAGTGAPGSQGARGSADPTNQPGQLEEGLTGLGPPDTSQSGAPGGSTTPNSAGGGSTVTYTKPGSGVGTYEQISVSDDLSGPRDSTMANDEGYGTGGPQIPGMGEPVPGGKYQPGSGGHVHRGNTLYNRP